MEQKLYKSSFDKIPKQQGIYNINITSTKNNVAKELWNLLIIKIYMYFFCIFLYKHFHIFFLIIQIGH